MKHLIILLLLFLLAAAAASPAWAEEKADRRPWEGKTWFVFGDSITSMGYYIEPVNEELGTISVKYDHSGYDYPQLAAEWQEMLDADFGPDLITIFAGTNDFGHSAPLEETANAVRVILRGLYTKYPSAQVIVITPLQRNTDPETHPEEAAGLGPNKQGKYLADYVEAIKEAAREYGTPVLDLYACGGINVINAREKTQGGDGLHPSEAYGPVLGHIIARFILNFTPMN